VLVERYETRERELKEEYERRERTLREELEKKERKLVETYEAKWGELTELYEEGERRREEIYLSREAALADDYKSKEKELVEEHVRNELALTEELVTMNDKHQLTLKQLQDNFQVEKYEHAVAIWALTEESETVEGSLTQQLDGSKALHKKTVDKLMKRIQASAEKRKEMETKYNLMMNRRDTRGGR
jgi:type I restriction-modification system DNA methylase subunit